MAAIRARLFELEQGKADAARYSEIAPVRVVHWHLTRFEVRQAWFTSKDGTRVPMFVVLRRGLARHGSHSTIL